MSVCPLMTLYMAVTGLLERTMSVRKGGHSGQKPETSPRAAALAADDTTWAGPRPAHRALHVTLIQPQMALFILHTSE